MPLVVSAFFCFGNEDGVLISGTFSRWHTATEVKRHTRQLQRGHSPYRGFQRHFKCMNNHPCPFTLAPSVAHLGCSASSRAFQTARLLQTVVPISTVFAVPFSFDPTRIGRLL